MGKRNWNPWTEHLATPDRLDSGLAHDDAPPPQCGERASWRPVADIFETVQALILQIELPGLNLEDVTVEAKQREIMVFGLRRFEKNLQGAAYHALERGNGKFSRRFPLPPTADTAAITATLKNGLMTIVIPKKAPCETNRRIPIKTT